MADEIQSPGPSFGTVTDVIKLLEPLTAEDRLHVLRTVATWFRVELHPQPQPRPEPPAPTSQTQDDEKFSNRPVLSAKDFIFEKNPSTDSERVACLAYYLTHFRETPHFKTSDLNHLNTEAAQRHFSNPSVASSNAFRDGFIVSAPKQGHKQLSAMGERFVHALPDREAAQQVRQRMQVRRSRRKFANGDDANAPKLEGEQL